MIFFVANRHAEEQNKTRFVSNINFFLSFDRWLKLQFQKADVNKNGYLTFKEVFNMLNKLNLEISHNYAKQMFQVPYKLENLKPKTYRFFHSLPFRKLISRKLLVKVLNRV